MSGLACSFNQEQLKVLLLFGGDRFQLKSEHSTGY